ncbi:Uncharacterised protein [Candidatus Gugararchaeum adminiculabundum]|nr:Uncharacterised protein [Candidatus Gugararchaeum adminiculabundum]
MLLKTTANNAGSERLFHESPRAGPFFHNIFPAANRALAGNPFAKETGQDIKSALFKKTFRRGYIFGEKYLDAFNPPEVFKGSFMNEQKYGLDNAWGRISTPLEDYSARRRIKFNGSRLKFKDFLLAKIAEAEAKGEVLKVLDLGIGTGEQWIEFLKENEGRIEFYGTALTMHSFHPELIGKVTLCSAAELNEIFHEGFFDLVVSHIGIYYQEAEAIENILHVLRPGGEAVITGMTAANPPDLLRPENHQQFYEIISMEGNGHWTFHLRKPMLWEREEREKLLLASGILKP